MKCDKSCLNGIFRKLALCCLVMFSALGGAQAMAADQVASALVQGEDGSDYGVVCYRNNDGMVLAFPDGWHVDLEVAERMGVCSMFLYGSEDFNKATGVMYPQVNKAPKSGKLEAIADAQAKIVAEQMDKKSEGQGPTVAKGDPIKTKSGLTFAIRYFDNGPYPNVAEASAYAIKGDTLFSVVLSAYDEDTLDELMPEMLNILETAKIIKVKDNAK